MLSRLATQVVDHCLPVACVDRLCRSVYSYLTRFSWDSMATVSSYGITVEFSKVKDTAEVFSFAPWIEVLFITSLVTNMYCTGKVYWPSSHAFIDALWSVVMIALRIWTVDRASGAHRLSQNTLKPVLVVVIESGAIYSSWLFALLVAYLAKSWLHYLFLESVSDTFIYDAHFLRNTHDNR